MVERTSTSGGLTEFKGTVVDVVMEKNNFNDTETDQYHITMKAEGITVKGKTGVLHEWVRLSAKATDEMVQEGSIVERYISQLEMVMPEVKKCKKVSEVFNMLKGKKFLFRKVKLGRAFEGKPAKELWCPVSFA